MEIPIDEITDEKVDEIIARKGVYYEDELTFRFRRNVGRSHEILLTEYLVGHLGLSVNDSIMFSFNRSGHYGYIWKEEPLQDNYRIRKKTNQKGFTIWSSSFAEFFKRTFELDDQKISWYQVEEKPTNGKWKFTKLDRYV